MQQLGLFDDRNLRLQRARRVLLESLDLESAAEELTLLLARGGTPEAEQLAVTVAGIEGALVSETRRDSDLVAALGRLEPDVPDWLRPGWHRRLALEAEQRDGLGCRIGAETSGWHLLRAGDLKEAERSLRAALARDPADARSRAHLADIAYQRRQPDLARVEYLRALVDAPERVDWDQLADPEIAALPAIATSEYEVATAPATWAAAVGTVEGLLPWPALRLPGVDEPSRSGGAHAGLEFYRLLCDERRTDVLAERARVRRQMKALSPALLEAYLERWR